MYPVRAVRYAVGSSPSKLVTLARYAAPDPRGAAETTVIVAALSWHAGFGPASAR
jgi:hypothetical protein